MILTLSHSSHIKQIACNIEQQVAVENDRTRSHLDATRTVATHLLLQKPCPWADELPRERPIKYPPCNNSLSMNLSLNLETWSNLINIRMQVLHIKHIKGYQSFFFFFPVLSKKKFIKVNQSSKTAWVWKKKDQRT